ncbi:hypothetical protein IU433_09865 [Nocardia puris]|uniref:Uncharacterized protein n=1 Tax=Nocardia puris TaxID=208602 RepID=A0A366DT71_9NOCA|nr:hypothetical protein [Nocardia puris]MBF6210817.1 hypothetical protein [Nocardia puris]MBF6364412.1 hypothetical protein [Nocardia puris]MBF6459341.1 hypothetical protein [Nocardia puris]RBO92699.1 hypothetical protein DFR74_103343 [Nocardia puris]
MRIINDHLAVPARLGESDDNGYLLLAAEVGGWLGLFPLPSKTRARLVDRVAELAEKLDARADVVQAVAFRAIFRTPGEGSELLRRHGVRPARYDVAVLIRTKTVEAIDDVRADNDFRALRAALAESERVHEVASRNIARIAEVAVDDRKPFLFNYFHATDTETLIDVWRYTAGWFQEKTHLPDSTLLRPIPGEPGDYGIVNFASWPNVRTFLPKLVFHPQFRRFVLANFAANGIAAQPIIYRHVPAR